MKKIIASLAIAAMAFAIAPAQASNLSVVADTYVAGQTADIVLDFDVDTEIASGATFTVVANDAAMIAAAGAITPTAVNNTDADVPVADGTFTAGAGTVTFTTGSVYEVGDNVTVTISGVALPVAGTYTFTANGETISFVVVDSTSFNDNGSAVVTAVVLPGVAITVTNTDTAFGVLATDGTTTTTAADGTNIVATANTPSDLIVTAKVTSNDGVNYGLLSDDGDYVINGAVTGLVDEDAFVMAAVADNGSTAGFTGAAAGTAFNSTDAEVEVARVTTSGTTTKVDANVQYGAKAATTAEADNYSATIVYTASTTF